ncbi:MAG: hypothetical protein WAM44_15120, partial [Chthoniobacterales bacterium]
MIRLASISPGHNQQGVREVQGVQEFRVRGVHLCKKKRSLGGECQNRAQGYPLQAPELLNSLN